MFAVRQGTSAILAVAPWLVLLVAAIVAGIIVVYFLRFLRNREVGEQEYKESLLSQFQELHRKGVLSPDEMRGVRASLAHQIKRESKEADAGK